MFFEMANTVHELATRGQPVAELNPIYNAYVVTRLSATIRELGPATSLFQNLDRRYKSILVQEQEGFLGKLYEAGTHVLPPINSQL